MISTVGIAGAGTMGQGIAMACALAGYKIFLYDVNTTFCKQSTDKIKSSYAVMVAKGKLSESAAASAFENISTVEKLSDLRADLIIEAIVENLSAKQALFLQLEETNSAQSIFASNTSSISVTEIASVLKYPSRLAGLHFFNPAHLMRLVEIISGVATKESVLNELQNFSTSIEKVCVQAKDSPGFIVNRIARPFYSEALKILEEETASVSDIDLLLRSAGFKMGPFELMDLIGLDVNFAVTTSVYEGLNKPSRFTPSGIQRKKIEEGALGRKSGKGFYEYQKK